MGVEARSRRVDRIAGCWAIVAGCEDRVGLGRSDRGEGQAL